MYVDKEDRDVMNMCHENRRRSRTTTTVGYFVPKEQAWRIAADEAAQKRRGGDWQGIGFMILSVLAVGAATVAVLV